MVVMYVHICEASDGQKFLNDFEHLWGLLRVIYVNWLGYKYTLA